MHEQYHFHTKWHHHHHHHHHQQQQRQRQRQRYQVHLSDLTRFYPKGTMPEITKVLKKAPRHPTSKGAKVYLIIWSVTDDKKVHLIRCFIHWTKKSKSIRSPPKDECFPETFAIQTFNKCDDILGSLLVSTQVAVCYYTCSNRTKRTTTHATFTLQTITRLL